MKIAVRALVLGMLLIGFSADHMLATKAAPTSTTTMTASTSVRPAPGCNPGSSSCGMDDF